MVQVARMGRVLIGVEILAAGVEPVESIGHWGLGRPRSVESLAEVAIWGRIGCLGRRGLRRSRASSSEHGRTAHPSSSLSESPDVCMATLWTRELDAVG